MSSGGAPMGTHTQRLGPGVHEDALLDRCDYLASVGFWTGDVTVRPRLWLSNFQGTDDRKHALHLLGVLQFYNAELCRALIASGLRDVVRAWINTTPHPDSQGYEDQWMRVAASIAIYAARAAGPAFEDAARAEAGDKGLALAPAISTDDEHSVLIVDCVGPSTDAEIAAFRNGRDPDRTAVLALLAPLWAGAAQTIGVHSVHDVPSVYSMTHPESVVWPPELRESGPDFVTRVRTELGLTEPNDPLEQTAICFGHRMPDIVDSIFIHGSSGDYEPLLLASD